VPWAFAPLVLAARADGVPTEAMVAIMKSRRSSPSFGLSGMARVPYGAGCRIAKSYAKCGHRTFGGRLLGSNRQ
jgi:hypothetical protein